ncbi:MAG: PAS-domain containing protein, partial [Pseudomonadota bacterium]
MQNETDITDETALYAEFDAAGRLLAVSPGFLEGGDAGAYLDTFAEIDGEAMPAVRARALAAWWTPGAPVMEARRADGAARLLCAHPTATGGRCLLSLGPPRADAPEQAPEQAPEPAAAEAGPHAAVLEASPASHCLACPETGAVHYRSPAFTAQFGAEATAADLFADPRDWEAFLAALRHSGQVDDWPATARSAEGGLFPALFSARLTQHDGAQAMVCTAADLTDRHRTMATLLDANRQLRDAVEALDQGFALYDAEDRLLLWNRRYAQLNSQIAHVLQEGVRYHEILEAAIDVHRLEPEISERVRATGRRRCGEAEPHRFEFEPVYIDRGFKDFVVAHALLQH